MKTKLIVLLLIINLALKAQDTNIIFYDYIPDYTISSQFDTLKIDLNQDGLNDVAFYRFHTSVQWNYVKTLNPNAYFCYFGLTDDDSLTSTQRYWYSSPSYWPCDIDRERIGVKLIDGANDNYGWIKTFMDSCDIYPRYTTIKEYAFCKIANYPFLFGQTTTLTAINELTIDNNTQVYFNGSTANIVIQSDKQIKEVKLVNMLGANVVSYSNVNTTNTNINTTNLAHGNYIVQIKFANSAVYAVQVAF